MEHNEFKIGEAFTNGDRLWRCTDIGTRTIVAMCINEIEAVIYKNDRQETRILDPRQDPSWFSGPPYAIAETVFDEYDIPAYEPVAEEDVMSWKPDSVVSFRQPTQPEPPETPAVVEHSMVEDGSQKQQWTVIVAIWHGGGPSLRSVRVLANCSREHALAIAQQRLDPSVLIQEAIAIPGLHHHECFEPQDDGGWVQLSGRSI